MTIKIIGGKFIEKDGKHSAWNNFMAIMRKRGYTMQEIGKMWQEEKTKTKIHNKKDVIRRYDYDEKSDDEN